MMVLRRSPLCHDCGTAATEVHHLEKKSEGGHDAFENVISVCRRCHNKRTRRGE